MAYTYPVPYEWLEQHGVRRYGFHGTSHRFVPQRALAQAGLPADDHAIVTAHLGNGCSCAAVRNGHSVDTTMGLTPLEGLMMGTRTGSVDPALIGFVANATGQSEKAVLDSLNRRSGLAGVSGISNDLRELEEAAGEGHARAGSPSISSVTGSRSRSRASWCRWAGWTPSSSPAASARTRRPCAPRSSNSSGSWACVDPAANATHGRAQAGRVTTTTRPQALVVATDEELMIAMDTAEILQVV